MRTGNNNHDSGFTLVETIVTIVLLSIVVTMMLSYFSTALTYSSESVSRLGTSTNLNGVMGKITADYMKVARWQPDTSYAPGTRIIPPFGHNNCGCEYQTVSGGTSGPNEPGWPIDQSSVTDNNITWQYNGSALLTNFQTAIGLPEGTIQNNSFGNYRVIQNRFIKFDPSNTELNINNAPSDFRYGHYLKVSIAPVGETSEALTTLFVRQW